MGASPAMILTLLAWPKPANTRWPDLSRTSTHASAEKLKRRRARPEPTVSVSAAGVRSTAGIGAAESRADTGMALTEAGVAATGAATGVPVASSDGGAVGCELEAAADGVAGCTAIGGTPAPRWCQGFHK